MARGMVISGSWAVLSRNSIFNFSRNNQISCTHVSILSDRIFDIKYIDIINILSFLYTYTYLYLQVFVLNIANIYHDSGV